MYTIRTITANQALEYSSKSTPNLLAIGRASMAADVTAFLTVARDTLEGAIRELSAIALPGAIALSVEFAKVR